MWYELMHWTFLLAFCSNEVVSLILTIIDSEKWKEVIRANSLRGLMFLVLFFQTQ